jgi:hypothetical protein
LDTPGLTTPTIGGIGAIGKARIAVGIRFPRAAPSAESQIAASKFMPAFKGLD